MPNNSSSNNPCMPSEEEESRAYDVFDCIRIITLDGLPRDDLLLTPAGRAELLADLRLDKAPVGAEPRRLMQYVSEVMAGLTISRAEGFDEILPAAERQRFDLAATSLTPVMQKLAELGRAIDPSALGAAGASTDAHPWLRDADHVEAAALPLVSARAGQTRSDAAARLAAAARLIAGLGTPAPGSTARRKPGPAGARGDAYRIVRAVCLYRWQQGEPIECRWGSHRHEGAARGSARADDEVTPVSDTALLIAAVRTVLRLPVRNASLAKAHKTFLVELGKEERGHTREDLLIVE